MHNHVIPFRRSEIVLDNKLLVSDSVYVDAIDGGLLFMLSILSNSTVQGSTDQLFPVGIGQA